MMYKVIFTQKSEHRVGSIVEAESELEASEKARAGDCIEEFDLEHPESMEFVRFIPKPISPLEAEIWIKEQKDKLRNEDINPGELAQDIENALCMGPMNLFDQRMSLIWKKHFNADWKPKFQKKG